MSVLFLDCSNIDLSINQLINSLIVVDESGDVGLNTYMVSGADTFPVSACDYEDWEQIFRQMIVIDDNSIKIRVFQ